MIINNVTYIQVDNQFNFCVGQNVTRKPAREFPNTIVAVIKKDRMRAPNIVKERYNAEVRKALLKLK